MGRTGKLIAFALKQKGEQVVGVDLGPPEDFDEWCDQHRVRMIFGDFNSRALLEKMGAARARSIVFASGDDLANLEGALSAYEWLQSDEGPIRLIWAQITNDRLANTARAAVRTSGKVGIRFFDTYRIAALRMIAKYFNRNFRKEISEVNILGFGKFGRDLLDVLVNDLHSGEQFNIRVIDMQDRESAVRSLAEELGVAKRVTFQKTAIQDVHLGGEVEKVYFICTDDDLGNLTASMSLACDPNTTRIYVRMEHWPLSGVADNVGEDRGVFFININDLVVQGIEDLPGIFEPAHASDLKRTKLGRPSRSH
jgi:Trk K+ transport system NAD-binding subunit